MKAVLQQNTIPHSHHVPSESPRAHIAPISSARRSGRKVAAKAQAAPLPSSAAREGKRKVDAKAQAAPEQYTVRLESLGCPKNVVDGTSYTSI